MAILVQVIEVVELQGLEVQLEVEELELEVEESRESIKGVKSVFFYSISIS